MNIGEPLSNPIETECISACEYLIKKSRHNFEIRHLHADLRDSNPEVSQLSQECLERVISLKSERQFDLKKALSILEKNEGHAPSNHLRALLLEIEGQDSKAQEMYELNIDYIPSMLRLATMYYENRTKTDKAKVEEIVLHLIEECQTKGFVHSDNLLGCLYDSQFGKMNALGKEQCKLKAYEYFEKAANKNCACGMFNMARMANDGEGPFSSKSREERDLITKNFYEKASFELNNYRAITTLLDLCTSNSGYFATMPDKKRIEYTLKLYNHCKDLNVDYNMKPEFLKRIQLIDQGGILHQDVLNSIFCNGFFAEKYGYNYIEEEDYLIYSEDGFKVEFLGALFQGKNSNLSRLGNEGTILKYRECEYNDFKDLPLSYQNQKLRQAVLEIDVSKFSQNDKIKKINFHIISKIDPQRED